MSDRRGKVTSERVTWVRTENGQPRITHPTLWKWIDEDGTERYYDSREDALEAQRVASLATPSVAWPTLSPPPEITGICSGCRAPIEATLNRATNGLFPWFHQDTGNPRCGA